MMKLTITVGGASYTSPHLPKRFASQGLAELAPPEEIERIERWN